MKLCTVIAYYGLKMIEFSSYLKLNEIHMVDSPYKENPKYIFSRDPLISGEGWPENLGKWVIPGTSIAMQIGG